MSIHLEQLLNQLEFNYQYLLDLVSDIDEKYMTHTPSRGLENHPAFTIGHIITAYGMMIKKLGGHYTINKKWDEIFRRNGPGDPRYPTTDKNLYPSKEALILELKKQHEVLLKYLKGIELSTLNKIVDWRFRQYFPKMIDLLHFMLITHYSMHIGQIAAWRRAMNLTSSLARL